MQLVFITQFLTSLSSAFLHLLEKETDDFPELKKRVLLLQECNERIQKILRGLREFARSTEFEFTSLDVNDAVLSVVAITRQQLLNQGIEVQLKLNENLPHVLGDKNQIEQVLFNLIANARDAMEQSKQKAKRKERLQKLKQGNKVGEVIISGKRQTIKL